jgi:pyruvate formate lyase activating enzyme
MIIAGFAPNSCVDYPKNIAAVVFLPGCNFDCWYCHNRDIIEGSFTPIDEKEVLEKIEKRKRFLDGVVITGGEPLLTSLNELKVFIEKIKAMGLLVKLDTNGTFPEKLEELLPMLDYVAMDIKAPISQYKIVTPMREGQEENIRKSIKLLMNSSIDYEFRTTFDPNLTKIDIKEIAEMIAGAKAYSLQQINIPKGYEDKFTRSSEYLTECAEIASQYVPTKVKNI